jgi:hypothetical protein
MSKDQRNNGFFAEIFSSLAKTAGRLILAFSIGTGASALVCLFYGAPIAFSLIGGFIVLGIALALMSDSLFF